MPADNDQASSAKKKKASRPDVVSRIARKKITTCSVVKMSWAQFCKPAAECLDVAYALQNINKTAFEAGLFANFHIARLLEGETVLPKVDQDFFYKCCSAVSLSSERRQKPPAGEDLALSLSVYESWRPEAYRPAASDYLCAGSFNNLSQQMATCARNHITTNLYTRMKKYLKLTTGCTGAVAYNKLRFVFSEDAYLGDDADVIHLRSFFSVSPTVSNVEKDIRIAFPFLKAAQEAFEAEVDKDESMRGIRLFSLLPLKDGFTTNYIKICTTSLHSLLRRSVKRQSCTFNAVPSRPDFQRQRDDYWRALFRVEKLETSNRKFDYEILTDGKAVSVVMRRPKHATEDCLPRLDANDYDQIWGLDPGMTDMATASDDVKAQVSFSSAAFYSDAKYTQSRRRTESWLKKRQDIAQAISDSPTKRSGRLHRMEAYARYIFKVADRLFDFYGARRFKNLKLRRYIHSKQALVAICKRLTGKAGKRTLVGFGDWSIGNCKMIRGCNPGPSNRLRKELRKRCTVVDVDEFRSSQRCSQCSEQMTQMTKKVIRADRSESHVKVHRVQHCSNSVCSCKTINRDRNASLNLLLIVQCLLFGRERPIHLSRSV